MPLEDGAIYQTPDGRKLRAASATRRYHAERAWTLLPIDAGEESNTPQSTREHIGAMLFLEGERLYRFVFNDRPVVQDTGWTVRDLIHESRISVAS